MDISRLSASRLILWNNCSLAYKFRYHDKLPTGPAPAAEFGSFVHKIYEHAVLDGEDPKKLAKKFLEKFKFPHSYLELLPQMIRRWEALNEKIPLGDPEKEFTLDLPGTDIPLVGVIDRVIEMPNGLLVVDYKTGRWQKSKRQLKEDPQLTLYSYAASKLYGVKPENITLGLWYTRTGDMPTVKFTQDQVTKYIHYAGDVANTIRDTPPEDAVAKINNLCNVCDFNDRCETYKKYQILKSGKIPQ